MKKSKDEGHGDCIHFWANGKIIFDSKGTLQKLQEEAREQWKKGPALGTKWEWRWAKHDKYKKNDSL